MGRSSKAAALTGEHAIEARNEVPQATQLRGVPKPINAPVTAETEPEENNAPLNFRVSAAFRREFRVYAATHDLKLNELLQLAFEHYQTRAPVTGLSRSVVAAASILATRGDGTDLSDLLQGLLEQWIAEQA